MTIKEIIKTMGTLLDRQEVADYLSGDVVDSDSATEHAVGVMAECVNIVLGELAGTYLPMIAKESFAGGEIQFSSFMENVVKIIDVLNENGKPKKYVQYPDKIVTATGKTQIEYQYIPKNYQLDDKIGYTESDVSKTIIAYGAISELCLIERSFDESVMWRNRYMESLKKILLPKNKKIKQRSWL